MGLKVEPAYIGQTGYLHPVELDRNLLEGLFQRSGGVRYGDFAISQGVGTRAIAIAPGRFFVLGQENAQQGGYFVWSDAIETFLLAAAVGNPRIDTILIRVIDDQYGSISGAPRAEFAVVQGVASGAPVARANSDFLVGGSFYIPGGWARLGDVRVNVADTGSIPTGQITTQNRYVRPPNSNIPCLSTDRPSDAVMGDSIYEIDTKLRWTHDGTQWVVQPGQYRSDVVSAGTLAQVTWNNLPTSVKTWRIDYTCRTNAAVTVTTLNMLINNDSTNYFWNFSSQNGATVTPVTSFGSFGRAGAITGASSSAGQFANGHVDITNWNRAHDKINALYRSHYYDTSGNSYYDQGGFLWNVAANNTRIDLLPATGAFIAGSQFTLSVVN